MAIATSLGMHSYPVKFSTNTFDNVAVKAQIQTCQDQWPFSSSGNGRVAMISFSSCAALKGCNISGPGSTPVGLNDCGLPLKDINLSHRCQFGL